MNAVAIVRNVFAAIGTVLLILAFYFYQNTQEFIQGALTADGLVTELTRSSSRSSSNPTHKNISYRPVVEFRTSDGTLIEFTSTSGSNPPSYRVGEAVKIFYHLDRPHHAKINGFFSLWGMPLIFAGVGALFSLFGFAMIYFARRRQSQIKFLKQRGSPVKANFQSVERNRSVRVNGRSPYQIYAQWQDPFTSKLHVFKSEDLWFNPEQYLTGDEITVLIDDKNPKKHYMDISFLPELSD